MAAAQAGNFVAVERLSQRYMIGDGVPVDRNKAVELLETAAAKGHTGSRISLARLLLANLDLKDALPKATQALKQEAQRGNVRAFELLAQISMEILAESPTIPPWWAISNRPRAILSLIRIF